MSRLDTPQKIRAFCSEHDELISALTDALAHFQTDPQTGESVLCFLCGVSIGRRTGSLLDKDLMEAMARGWQIGVDSLDQELPL